MANIRLRFPATCKECGTHLPIGAEARYYKRGRTAMIYGVTCHGDTRPDRQPAPSTDYKQAAAGERGDYIDVDRIAEEEGARLTAEQQGFTIGGWYNA